MQLLGPEPRTKGQCSRGCARGSAPPGPRAPLGFAVLRQSQGLGATGGQCQRGLWPSGHPAPCHGGPGPSPRHHPRPSPARRSPRSASLVLLVPLYSELLYSYKTAPRGARGGQTWGCSGPPRAALVAARDQAGWPSHGHGSRPAPVCPGRAGWERGRITRAGPGLCGSACARQGQPGACPGPRGLAWADAWVGAPRGSSRAAPGLGAGACGVPGAAAAPSAGAGVRGRALGTAQARVWDCSSQARPGQASGLRRAQTAAGWGTRSPSLSLSPWVQAMPGKPHCTSWGARACDSCPLPCPQ